MSLPCMALRQNVGAFDGLRTKSVILFAFQLRLGYAGERCYGLRNEYIFHDNEALPLFFFAFLIALVICRYLIVSD